MAIRSFRHKGLELFYATGSKAGVLAAHAARLQRLLNLLDSAIRPEEMDVSGARLHALTGAHAGRYAMRVNGNWRLTFAFESQDAVLVDYEDYH